MKFFIPRQLAVRGARLNLSLQTEQLSRFLDCVVKASPEVRVDFQFELDDNNLPRVRGSLATKVWQHCQRCLQLTPFSLVADVDMRIVHNDEAAGLLPKDQDAFTASGPQVQITELVEDGLIMALPMVCRHQRCDLGNLEKDAPEDSESYNPFASLRINDKGRVSLLESD